MTEKTFELYISTPLRIEGTYKGVAYRVNATCLPPECCGFGEPQPRVDITLTVKGRKYESQTMFVIYDKELKEAKVDYDIIVQAIKCTIDNMG